MEIKYLDNTILQVGYRKFYFSLRLQELIFDDTILSIKLFKKKE